MIEIRRYREWLIELVADINRESEGQKIDGVVMAVHEGHLIRKLRDRRGVWLCARFPDWQVNGSSDVYSSDNEVLLFLVEKVPSGQHDDEEELNHYARLQGLMIRLRDKLWEGNLLCDDSVQLNGGMKFEWEYDLFGGWNGLSVSFKLEDFY